MDRDSSGDETALPSNIPGAPEPVASAAPRSSAEGLAYAVAAYGLWGLSVAYYKLVGHIPLIEIIAHRIVWSLLLVGGLLAVWIGFAPLRRVLSSRRTMLTLALTSVLVSINWSAYVWAVNVDRVLEVSFGYYINPLVSVVLGVVLLGERLSRAQLVAVLLAAIAVLILGVYIGTLPWLPLGLAMSFALYGYFRKTVDAGAAEGVFVEVMLLTPFALAAMVWFSADGTGRAFDSTENILLLVTTSLWTAVPLMFFAAGARRLRLATIGLLQYIAPSLQFLMAVFLFGETPTLGSLIAFVLIWTALAIYSIDSIKAERKLRRRRR